MKLTTKINKNIQLDEDEKNLLNETIKIINEIYKNINNKQDIEYNIDNNDLKQIKEINDKTSSIIKIIK